MGEFDNLVRQRNVVVSTYEGGVTAVTNDD